MKQRFRSWFVAAAALLFTPFLASAAEKIAITVTPYAEQKVYDGTGLTAYSNEVTFTGKVKSWASPGDHVVAEYADELTDVRWENDIVGGTVATIPSRIVKGTARVLNAQGNDVSDSYVISTGESTLKVTPRKITLTSATNSKSYDGTPLSDGTVLELGDGWAKGEGATYDVKGSQTDVGSSKNIFAYNLKDGTNRGNYLITTQEGTLTVNKASSMTVTIKDGVAKYNGTKDALELTSGASTDPVGFNVEIKAVCTNKNAGAYTADAWSVKKDTVVIKKSGKDVTSFFGTVTVNDSQKGSLTIAKRSVGLMSGGGKKQYDGTPLVNKNVTVSGDGWVVGEGATYNVTGSQIEIGSSDNEFTYTLNANTSEANYDVTTVVSILEVTPRNSNLTITAPTVSKVYDGLALSSGVCTVTTNGVCGLAAGDYLASCTATNELTYVGISSNDVTYVIKNAQGADVTKNYTVTVIQGKLEITKRPITVQFFDTTYEYDGEAHYPTNAVVAGTSLAPNDVFVVTQWDWDRVDAGVYACTNCGWAVSNVTTKMFVSANYDVTLTNKGAFVTITKRPATVTTGSAEKIFDGKPLTNEVVTITGLADADTNDVSAVATGTRTEVGRADNTVKISWGEAKEANYSVTTNLGVLTVKAQRLAYDLQGGEFTNRDQVAWSFVPVESQPTTEITNEYNAAKWLSKTVDPTGAHKGPYSCGYTNVVQGGWAMAEKNRGYNFFTNTLFSTANDIVFADPSVAVTPEYVRDNRCGCCVKTNQNVDAYLTLTNRAQAVEFAAYVDQRWAAAEKAFDEATKGAKVRFYTPVREGYVFVGWKNELTGVTYPGDGSEQTLPKSLAESDIALFKAVWEPIPGYVQPELAAKYNQDTDEILAVTEPAKQVGTREALFENATVTDDYAFETTLKIKLPAFVNDKDLMASNVIFCCGSTNALAITPKWETDSRTMKSYYYIEWNAAVTRTQLDEALKDGTYAETKLYCKWDRTKGADGKDFTAVYTVAVDPMTCTLLGKDGQQLFPRIQKLAWEKGYRKTTSEVNSNDWADATAVTFYTNTLDYALADDLVRTGYTFVGWAEGPCGTKADIVTNLRGLVAKTKDNILSSDEVILTALWETNRYNTVFANDSTNAIHRYAISEDYYFEDYPTNNWTVENLAMPLPMGDKQFLSKYYNVLNWTNALGNAYTNITVGMLGTNGNATFTFYPNRAEKVFNVFYDLTNGFAQINKEGTPYLADANNITQYTVSTNGGAKIKLADASCFGCKFLGWFADYRHETQLTMLDPMAAKDLSFAAKWAEYQAMVVENDTATTNFFDSVSAALATVTNSNTTIAFLDAKGDGLQGACPIEIAANLTNIVINFCALDYTNDASEAALTVGTNAEVTVRNHPLAIGWNTNAIARLVQLGGGTAVKVGENAKFTLDDDKLVLDVLRGENAANAQAFQELQAANEVITNGVGFITTNATMPAIGYGGLKSFVELLRTYEMNGTPIIWSNELNIASNPYYGVAYQTNSVNVIFTNLAEAVAFETEWTNKEAVAQAKWMAFKSSDAIYAPESATLVLKAGMIGATNSLHSAGIKYDSHREYLGSTNLFFAMKPRQQCGNLTAQKNRGFESQVAPGYIWTMNANKATSNEFAYTVSPIEIPAADLSKIRLTSLDSKYADGEGHDGPETAGLLTNLYNRIRKDIALGCLSNKWTAAVSDFSQPDWIDCGTALARAAQWTNGTWDVVAPNGTMLGTNATLVGTLLVNNSGYVTNKIVYVKNPSAVVVTNASVVAMYPLRTGDDPGRYNDPDTATFGLTIPVQTNTIIRQLVETLETGVATNVAAGIDWDGAAGPTNLNMVAYTLNYSGKDIVVSNATEQLFPKIGVISYVDEKHLLTGKQTYTVLDTTKEGGLALLPAIGTETNHQGGVYRFMGWEDYDHEGTILTNIIHTVGAGDDAKDRILRATWDRLDWTAVTNGVALPAVYFTPQEAVDALVKLGKGGVVRYNGGEEKYISAPLTVNGVAGTQYTIDLGGATFANSKGGFAGDYLLEVTNGTVTVTNGVLTTYAPGIGGVHAVTKNAVVTMKDNLKIDTGAAMVCAENGAYALANHVDLWNQESGSGVQVLDGATLEFTNVVDYCNTVFASNATFVANGLVQGVNLKVENGNETAIRAIAGSTVVLGGENEIANAAYGAAIELDDSSLEINDGTAVTNLIGNAVYATGATGEGAVVLNGGEIFSVGPALYVEAGALVVPAGSTVKATSKDAAILLDQKLGLLKAENIVLEGGQFLATYGQTVTDIAALKSVNTAFGETANILTNFLRYALVQADDKTVTKMASLFSTPVKTVYCKAGYAPSVDDELFEKDGMFWYFVKTIPYAIEYDLAEGTRVEGTEVWPTSYNVEDDVILLPSNTVKKTNYYFGGWTISNTVTSAVTTNSVITPGVDFGSLALKAIWLENACTVYVDYQGEDGYPRYYYLYDYAGMTNYWAPSTRYPYWSYAAQKDKGVQVSPSKNVTLKAPTYNGYEFVQFEDVNTGRRYEAGEEYTVLDFTFDAEQKVYLRAVWASKMSVYDDDGRVYKTIEDALASTNTVDGMTLRLVGNGTAFQVGKTLVIDKNVTLDLNGKQLLMSGDFEGDTVVAITNAPDAAVVGGTLDGADEVESIRVLDADGAAVAAIDSTWEIKTAVQVADDYLVEGFECVQDGDLWIVQFAAYALTFDDGVAAGSVREDLTVTLNNESAFYTKDSDPIVLNDPERTGYTFTGWVDEDGKKVVGVFVPEGKTKSTVLTATWTATSYAIRYELNGGVFAEAEKKTYTCEDEAFDLVNPVRLGYAFGGWRVDGADPADPATLAPRTWKTFGDVNAVAVWKVGSYEITFDVKGGEAVSPLRYTEESRIYVEIPVPTKAGAKFVKWVDENGDAVATGTPAKCFSAALTAVWEQSLWTGDNTVVTGNPNDVRGTVFNGNLSYTGYLLKGGLVRGKVAVTVGKPSTTTGKASVTMTVSQELGTGKTYTLKNTAVEVTGKVLENVTLEGGSQTATIAKISDNGLVGAFNGCAVIASADRFATNVSKVPAATLAYLQGNWTLAFGCGQEATCGATTLKLTVGAKGKVTVTGNLGDGTAVSTTAQLIYGDGVCLCPVVVNAYTGKKGGFSFLVWFGTTGRGDNLADDVEVTNIAPLTDAYGEEHEFLAAVATRVSDVKAAGDYVFWTDLDKFELPSGYELVEYDPTVAVEITDAGKAVVGKAKTAKIDAATGKVTFTGDGDNNLGLALSYTKTTGALTGSYKVYAKTQNATTKKWTLKTYTAKVYAVVGVNAKTVGAAGSASEKTLGATLVTLEPAAE